MMVCISVDMYGHVIFIITLKYSEISISFLFGMFEGGGDSSDDVL